LQILYCIFGSHLWKMRLACRVGAWLPNTGLGGSTSGLGYGVRTSDWLQSQHLVRNMGKRQLCCYCRTSVPLQRLTQVTQQQHSNSSTAAAAAAAEDEGTSTHAFPMERIRNFSIIAHVDHGKSTLADRILEYVGAIQDDKKNEQVLDKLQVEKERGITVKSQTVSFHHEHKGLLYQINLIDTPGHADFNYEVSRSLAACQGCILLVDANSGIQAQTVNNFFLAFERELFIIPVLNKIDLPHARPDVIAEQLVSVFDVAKDEILKISAKAGIGIQEVVEAVIERIPPPSGCIDKPLKALIFDSWFKQHKGVVALVTLQDGRVQVGDRIICHHTRKSHTVTELGVFTPSELPIDQLHAGQTGYIMSGMKDTADASIGDTISHTAEVDNVEPFEGFQKMKPVVFAGFFPVEPSNPAPFEKCIKALTLNDPSVEVSREIHPTLGNGYRLGFLGFLHLDVFRLRLSQEFTASAIVTAPSVIYKIRKKGSTVDEEMHVPEMIPKYQDCDLQLEPMVMATILTPKEFEPVVKSLCLERRSEEKERVDVDENRIMLKYRIPLNEIIIDFHETLKSMTSGFASFEYEEDGYEPTHLVKLEFNVNGFTVEELSVMVHNERARSLANFVVGRLKRVIPPQPFKIKIRGQVGNIIVASDNKGALKVSVAGKSMAQQNAAKKSSNKKARMAGEVIIPNDAFIQVLKG